MSQQGEKRKRGAYNTKTIQEKAAACCDLEGGMALWHESKKYDVSEYSSFMVQTERQHSN